jgi:hypothetical protein
MQALIAAYTTVAAAGLFLFALFRRLTVTTGEGFMGVLNRLRESMPEMAALYRVTPTAAEVASA